MNTNKTMDFPIPHKITEVICIFCGKRWMAARPELMRLRELECSCGKPGGIIETGEVIRESDTV